MVDSLTRQSSPNAPGPDGPDPGAGWRRWAPHRAGPTTRRAGLVAVPIALSDLLNEIDESGHQHRSGNERRTES